VGGCGLMRELLGGRGSCDRLVLVCRWVGLS